MKDYVLDKLALGLYNFARLLMKAFIKSVVLVVLAILCYGIYNVFQDSPIAGSLIVGAPITVCLFLWAKVRVDSRKLKTSEDTSVHQDDEPKDPSGTDDPNHVTQPSTF